MYSRSLMLHWPETWVALTELQPSTLFTLGGHAWSSKTQHVWCHAGLRGCKMRVGKAQSCSKQPSRSSHPPGTRAHIHLLMEPCTSCCLSNLNSGFIVYNCNWWFLVLPHSDSAMAQPWLSISLEGGLKTSRCFRPPRSIISKDYATSTVLALQPCCLPVPLPGTQSNFPVLSGDSALSVGNSSLFHTAATQELGPKPCWCPQEVWAGAKTSTMEPVLHPALERPAQMKIGQWLREEKERAWLPRGRRKSTTPNSSMDKWYYLEV